MPGGRVPTDAIDLRLGDVLGVREARVPEECAPEVGAREVGVPEVGVREHGMTEIHTACADVFEIHAKAQPSRSGSGPCPVPVLSR